MIGSKLKIAVRLTCKIQKLFNFAIPVLTLQVVEVTFIPEMFRREAKDPALS